MCVPVCGGLSLLRRPLGISCDYSRNHREYSDRPRLCYWYQPEDTFQCSHSKPCPRWPSLLHDPPTGQRWLIPAPALERRSHVVPYVWIPPVPVQQRVHYYIMSHRYEPLLGCCASHFSLCPSALVPPWSGGAPHLILATGGSQFRPTLARLCVCPTSVHLQFSPH